MSADTQRLKALAVIAFVGIILGGAAMFALAPESAAPHPQPELVADPPRPLSPATVRPAAELGASFIAISEAVTPAVVRIEAEHTASQPGSSIGRRLQDIFGNSGDGAAEPPLPEIAGGTGFLVTADGYILTNHHVIEGATRIIVALADKRTFTAQVIGSDPLTDVAVIRIGGTELPAIPLGDSDSTRVGEWVLAIGNPGFDGASTLDFTVTSGIISAKGRGLEVLATEESSRNLVIEDFIQTDAVINPGNSGGPLVNLRGAVIGINTAIASTTGSYQGYGFAIPSNLVRRVMRDLVEYGYMRRALLGVQISDVTEEDAEVYGLPAIAGVLVEDFNPDSPAERGGIQRHDVIVAVDGQPVSRVGELQQRIAQHDPGARVDVTLYRYGRQLTFAIPLQEAERTPAERAPAPTAGAPAALGLEVAELDAESAVRLGFDRAGGALVAHVLPGSAAFYRGVEEGHRIVTIDRRPVPSAREARRLLREARAGSVLSLLLEDAAGQTYITNIRVP